MNHLPNGNEQVFCTEDAKMCPDGSYVSRKGPNCEFSECPKTSKDNLIKLFEPKDGTEIESPLVIKGQARGYWFFEASFPVILTNWDGLIIAEGIAKADGEWMTEDFVPFEAVLNFKKPEYIGEFSKRGSLILKKDNPSGLPENDDALEITVYFK